MKGLQQKLELTQRIVVPSDDRSGDLAMLWKEGTLVIFKSCSNSHIDVEVLKEDGGNPWRDTGLYGHPDASMRHNSWDLLKALHTQAKMLWVVFKDFNEIVHLDEKLGWRDRDAK